MISGWLLQNHNQRATLMSQQAAFRMQTGKDRRGFHCWKQEAKRIHRRGRSEGAERKTKEELDRITG
jgi:hypothetical protein